MSARASGRHFQYYVKAMRRFADAENLQSHRQDGHDGDITCGDGGRGIGGKAIAQDFLAG